MRNILHSWERKKKERKECVVCVMLRCQMTRAVVNQLRREVPIYPNRILRLSIHSIVIQRVVLTWPRGLRNCSLTFNLGTCHYYKSCNASRQEFCQPVRFFQHRKLPGQGCKHDMYRFSQKHLHDLIENLPWMFSHHFWAIHFCYLSAVRDT